jgi:hypothetical protein
VKLKKIPVQLLIGAGEFNAALQSRLKQIRDAHGEESSLIPALATAALMAIRSVILMVFFAILLPLVIVASISGIVSFISRLLSWLFFKSTSSVASFAFNTLASPFSKRSGDEADGGRFPAVVEHLLSLILSDEDKENIIGDFHEEYSEVIKNNSFRMARAWVYKQVVKSVLPYVCNRIKERLAARFTERIR